MNYHATPAVTAVPGSNQTHTKCLPKYNFISVSATRQFCDATMQYANQNYFAELGN